MNKAYSTKALPPGTVLREWRLEEVLGVGGFGIVYKGRGIYFNELVAIKEYFPSSISERDEEATVVPVDSEVSEVHALGLKKFVEEAKLLWNLSTPSRHPNIVSVRSLFEIHGTAYMVMDFEDGVSLSRLIKQGQKWNERSLVALIKPIADGLERAHRVGVLHRDIKPPNILINDSGRPVLIDFGSARFEAAEATSTKVTFHTPPYAAIEQYVKTFEQGPWTDIYALGVVLYECVTGAKPPEVLERMHGGAGTPLAEGSWPGYSKRFLRAVDAAMAIKPTDRPRSISDWLPMFDGGEDEPEPAEADFDVTRIVPFDTSSEAIVPLAPAPSGFVPGQSLKTGVPDRPSEAEFKRSGHTKATRKPRAKKAANPTPAESVAVSAAKPDTPPPAPPVSQSTGKPEPAGAATRPNRKPLIAGAAAVLVLATAGGWMLLRPSPTPVAAGEQIVVPDTPAPVVVPRTALASGAAAFLAEAKAASAPDDAVEPLASLTTLLGAPPAGLDDAQAGERVRSVYGQFAATLLQSVDAQSTKMAEQIAWTRADPNSLPPERQLVLVGARRSLADLRSAELRTRTATDPRQSLEAARQALGHYRAFTEASTAIANLDSADQRSAARLAAAEERTLPAPTAVRPAASAVKSAASPIPTSSAAAPTLATTSDSLSPASTSQFNALVGEARDMARQVIRMGDRAKAGSSPQERADAELLRSNAQLARTYDASLVRLKDVFRSVGSDRQADPLIRQARQTRAYLVFLVKRSTDASRR
ncbi:hypothetical protein GCM10022280_15870 [Sphingomonas swuensis]|uniref:Protein kinase domain-containing protein n=1 Tax=Sphingomonas swuensis TaxID=977800 RepID=A0ABP7SWB0_9SPHN